MEETKGRYQSIDGRRHVRTEIHVSSSIDKNDVESRVEIFQRRTICYFCRGPVLRCHGDATAAPILIGWNKNPERYQIVLNTVFIMLLQLRQQLLNDAIVDVSNTGAKKLCQVFGVQDCAHWSRHPIFGSASKISPTGFRRVTSWNNVCNYVSFCGEFLMKKVF